MDIFVVVVASLGIAVELLVGSLAGKGGHRGRSGDLLTSRTSHSKSKGAFGSNAPRSARFGCGLTRKSMSRNSGGDDWWFQIMNL